MGKFSTGISSGLITLVAELIINCKIKLLKCTDTKALTNN